MLNEFKSIRDQNYTYKAVKKMLSGDLEKMIRKDKLFQRMMKALTAMDLVLFEEYDNIQDLFDDREYSDC